MATNYTVLKIIHKATRRAAIDLARIKELAPHLETIGSIENHAAFAGGVLEYLPDGRIVFSAPRFIYTPVKKFPGGYSIDSIDSMPILADVKRATPRKNKARGKHSGRQKSLPLNAKRLTPGASS